MNTEKIPSRNDVPSKDKWDLTKIYESDKDWEADLASIPSFAEKLESFKGKLADGADTLLAALKADEELDRRIEKVFHYASLLNSADQGNSAYQEMYNRAMMAYTAAQATTSFYIPELLSIPDEKINTWIEQDEFSDYRVYVKKALHIKPYTLSEKEERIMALQSESGQTANNAFSLLTDVDLDFGTVKADGVEKPLTQGTWSDFLESQDRNVRKEAYEKFYGTFEKHANTLSALYSGSVNNDIFVSRARGYKSSLEAALYSDKVPVSVYKNLIDTVHKNFDALHRFYSLRKKVLGVEELRHYDVLCSACKIG